MVVFYKQGLRERINVCLFALSLADELYLVNNMMWFGEQLHLHFTTKERFGQVLKFLTNNHLIGFYGFHWVSLVMPAIIASERCFCILRTSTMTAIVVVVNVVILGLVFLVVTRYHVDCAYDSLSGEIIMTATPGVEIPGIVMVVVVVTTIITTIKLRQAANWRREMSSKRRLSEKDIALTRMLVSNSVFFIACVFPVAVFRIVYLLMPEVNTGRRQHNFYMTLQWILFIISYFNSTFNIVVYYSMGSRYRQTFWQLFSQISGKA